MTCEQSSTFSNSWKSFCRPCSKSLRVCFESETTLFSRLFWDLHNFHSGFQDLESLRLWQNLTLIPFYPRFRLHLRQWRTLKCCLILRLPFPHWHCIEPILTTGSFVRWSCATTGTFQTREKQFLWLYQWIGGNFGTHSSSIGNVYFQTTSTEENGEIEMKAWHKTLLRIGTIWNARARQGPAPFLMELFQSSCKSLTLFKYAFASLQSNHKFAFGKAAHSPNGEKTHLPIRDKGHKTIA